MSVVTPLSSTWEILVQSLTDRCPVRAGYHGRVRLLCPHALGWDSGRAKVLAYQSGGTSPAEALNPRQRWRTLFVDELENPMIVSAAPWETADNYLPHSNCFEQMAFEVEHCV